MSSSAAPGKMGATAAKRLKLQGARLTIINRTHQRAAKIVERLGTGEAQSLPTLSDALRDADIAITSTGASHFLLDCAKVAEAMIARPARPPFIIDIAVPRDVDPDVVRIPGVALVRIDELSAAVDETPEARRRAVPAVEGIVAELARFVEWYRSRTAIPVITSLTQKADAIREVELERLLSRCPQLSPRERMLITGMSMTIVSRLLHSAIVRIREKAIADDGETSLHAQIVDELFELSTALISAR